MPLHCFFVGLILSIDGVGSYKTAQVLVTDGEGDNHEVSVKYYQSNENNLTVDSIYMISSTCILRLSKLPQFQLVTSILLNLNKNHLPSVNLDMVSVVTLMDSPRTMIDSTERYFSGSMYEYDSSERREVEMNLTFFFDGRSPLFERILNYLTVGKVVNMHFRYQFEDVGVDRDKSSPSCVEAYGHVQRISFMQNPPGSSKRAAIFESPRSRKAIRLGPTSKTTSSDPSSSLANRTAKIEGNSSMTMSSSGTTFDSAVAGPSLTGSEAVSSPSTLLSEPSLPDPIKFDLGSRHSSCQSSDVTNLLPSSETNMEIHEKRRRKKSQKLQD